MIWVNYRLFLCFETMKLVTLVKLEPRMFFIVADRMLWSHMDMCGVIWVFQLGSKIFQHK